MSEQPAFTDPSSFQDDTVIPQSQAEADNLRFSGLGETINPDGSPALDNVAQQAYDSARRLIENHSLRYELEHDDLTGLFTKRAMLANANKRLREAAPNQRFAMFFIDLDNFKAVNDLHPGRHDEGDAVLIDTANLLVKDTRQGEQFYDILAHGKREDSDPARLGGDELSIFADLTGRKEYDETLTPDERAQIIADRVQTDFDTYVNSRPDLKQLGLGLSICYVTNEPGDSAETMLIRADEKLKATKAEHHAQNGSYRPQSLK